ncbi:Pr6Pr family membrane protein [Streptomyces sp. C11-1]|uniref:Pr6Pr family membrane protein n=1 Tax=Streptomyces durocortorensis TaxID=2811104 RepID=A0ABY9VVC2_9ACTN|nr:Pr6Pr family membrane protein [Streptomyces durocortorensis]WNF27874.1 Pr6Pr family membrane protein [Streptomyces durocortorensis]
MTAPRTALLPRPRAAEVLPAAVGTPPRRCAAALCALVCATAAAGPLTALVTGDLGAALTHFTPLANLLVAGAFGWSAVRAWRDGRPLPPRLSGGVLLLVAVSALMYHLVLVNYAPDPLGPSASLLLHTVTPITVAAHWLLLTAPRTLRLAHIPLWLLAPLAYLALTLALGALLSPGSRTRYPYPFLNVDTYGYAGVLTQATALGLLFAALGVLLTAADHLRPNTAGWLQARRNRISPPAAGGLK